MHLIGVRYCKTVVLVKHYGLDIDLRFSISSNLSRKRFRKGNWQVVERRHCVLRETQRGVPQEAKHVQCPGYIHPYVARLLMLGDLHRL
jgi:hypothetical protein